MKKSSLFAVVLALAGAFGGRAQDDAYMGFAGAAAATKILVTIKADGTATIKTETTETRAQAEAKARMAEMIRKNMENEVDVGDEPPVPPPAAAETKPMTDAELTKALREGSNFDPADPETDSGTKIEAVDFASNSVRIVKTRSLDSLAKLVRSAPGAGIGTSGLRLETDTNQNLRITMTVQPGMHRYMKAVMKGWKAEGGKMEIKLILPGKILSSDLPHIEGNSTWLAVDATDEASAAAYQKFLEKSEVIIAESGGLKIDHPVDTKDAWRNARTGKSPSSSAPVTDAGAGFTAEAQSTSITTVYLFPKAKAAAKDPDDDLQEGFGEKPGLTVTAKLFVPRGREVISYSQAEVLEAVDDKGRSLKPAADTENEAVDSSEFSEIRTSGNAKQDSFVAELRLALPQADAQSVQTLSAQTVIETVGTWKEFVVTNVQSSVSNTIDLSSVLPGAKLTVTKVSGKRQQSIVKIRLTGPPEINQLDFKSGNDKEGGSNANETKFKAAGNESIREVQVTSYNYGAMRNQAAAAAAPASLTVRFPSDARRERFKFKLTGLDLF